ncbi:hypothetical protein [Paenibacillus filicis]
MYLDNETIRHLPDRQAVAVCYVGEERTECLPKNNLTLPKWTQLVV